MFKNINVFRILKILCGGFTQWAILITMFAFAYKMITAFSGFNVGMSLLCVASFFLLVIFETIFSICADGHDIMKSMKNH